MIKITKGVGFSTGDGNVEKFKLEFSESDIEKIKKCQAFIEDIGGGVYSVDLGFEAKIIHDSDFTPENEGTLRVFKNSLYFSCQSKYDASIQFESEQIENSELGL